MGCLKRIMNDEDAVPALTCPRTSDSLWLPMTRGIVSRPVGMS